MKKFLFATTAMVAVAGAASAEVGVSGFAEFGIFEDDNTFTTGQTHTDIDVTFSMSGEADNGLTFGATIDLDEIDGDGDTSNDTQMPDANMFLAFGPARLTVGDTDSAFDARLNEVAIGDSIRDDHTIHPGYNGNSALDEAVDSQVVRFDYTFDAFVASVSVNSDDTGVLDPTYAIGFSWATDLAGLRLGLGLGYISADEAAAAMDEMIGLSVATTFDNGLRAILNYSDMSDNSAGGADGSHYAIGLGYSSGALTVGANYGVYDTDGVGESSGYGLAVNYDLGGGLVAQLGWGGGDPLVGTYEDTYSLGLAMSF